MKLLNSVNKIPAGTMIIPLFVAAILSAVLCPFAVQWFAKHFGCPKYEKAFGKNQEIPAR